MRFNSLPSCSPCHAGPRSHLVSLSRWSATALLRAKPSCTKKPSYLMQGLGQEVMLSLHAELGAGILARSHPTCGCTSCQEALGRLLGVDTLLFIPPAFPISIPSTDRPKPPSLRGWELLPSLSGAAVGWREGIAWERGEAPGFGIGGKQAQEREGGRGQRSQLLGKAPHANDALQPPAE